MPLTSKQIEATRHGVGPERLPRKRRLQFLRVSGQVVDERTLDGAHELRFATTSGAGRALGNPESGNRGMLRRQVRQAEHPPEAPLDPAAGFTTTHNLDPVSGPGPRKHQDMHMIAPRSGVATRDPRHRGQFQTPPRKGFPNDLQPLFPRQATAGRRRERDVQVWPVWRVGTGRELISQCSGPRINRRPSDQLGIGLRDVVPDGREATMVADMRAHYRSRNLVLSFRRVWRVFMVGFIEGIDGDHTVLFPDQLEDWIGEDHLVRVVDLFVDELDLAGFGFVRSAAARTGRPGYHPALCSSCSSTATSTSSRPAAGWSARRAGGAVRAMGVEAGGAVR